jgi:hypothetical protein
LKRAPQHYSEFSFTQDMRLCVLSHTRKSFKIVFDGITRTGPSQAHNVYQPVRSAFQACIDGAVVRKNNSSFAVAILNLVKRVGRTGGTD